MAEWGDRTFVKLYHDNGPWMDVSLEARGLFDELLKVVDRAGILRVGADPARSVARAVNGVVSRVIEYLDELLREGCIVVSAGRLSAGRLVVRNYVGAQSARFALTAAPERQTFVYFVQCKSGPIKIGRADDPQKRLAALQTSTPESLVLLGVVRGGVGLERELHVRFAPLRLRGEWFRSAAPLLEFIGTHVGGK